MGKKILECIDCGAFMCQQSEPTGPGCIWLPTPTGLQEFRCIVCEPRHWRRTDSPPKGPNGGIQVSKWLSQQLIPVHSVQYKFVGYGGRQRAKLTWPMLLVVFTEASLPDRFMQRALQVDLEMQYMNAHKNVSSSCVLPIVHH